MLNEAKQRLKTEFLSAVSGRLLKKAVLSRPKSKEQGKTVFTPFEKDGSLLIKSEEFTSDNKALQKILSIDAAAELIFSAPERFKQINLTAQSGGLELIISDKGKFRFSGEIKSARQTDYAARQDAKKNYLITPEQDGEFLYMLGITDKNGRIHDKKQAKYRQINKFIEQIEAVSDALPSDEICVCDLCCGKSYLTFAVYRYLTFHKGMTVKMYGIDLKKDVIDYCRQAADRLGWGGMRFECGDVLGFTPPQKPDLVISLHACDVATDYALAGAVKAGARVILSTPCCHHEINSQIKCTALDFVLEHSILKQKISTAVTDALRARLLEIYGYKVTVCELIDPEETPKNVLIRAVLNKRIGNRAEKIEQYKAACALLNVSPTLAKLLER